MSHIWPVTAVILVMLCGQLLGHELLLGAEWFKLLRLEHSLFQSFEWWRLLSAHFIHMNFPHFLLNVGSLVISVLIFPELKPAKRFLISLLGPSIAVSIGILLFDPEIHWYVGFSGTLYGFLAVGAIGLLGKSFYAPWVLAFLVVKILWETLYGPMQSSIALVKGNVATQAHFYGVLGGVVVGAAMKWKNIQNRQEEQPVH